jgi:hypothetical protein
MKIRPVGDEFLHGDGQMTTLIVAFRNSGNALKINKEDTKIKRVQQ